MSYFARVIDNPAAWVGDYLGHTDDDFPSAIIADLLDKKGRPLSFWSIDSLELADVGRVVAAWFADDKKSQLNKVSLRFIDAPIPSELGIEVDQGAGNTWDKAFSQKHRNLHVRSVSQALGLARAMMKIDAQEFTQQQVISCFVGAVNEGHFDLKKMNKDMCKHLFDKGHLTIPKKD